MPLQLEIVTPERQAYSEEVDAVFCPGVEGEFGVLPHHAPLLSMLGVGELRIRKGADEEFFAIAGGFVQVRPDKVVVMAELADLSSEIDLEAAEEARFGGRSLRFRVPGRSRDPISSSGGRFPSLPTRSATHRPNVARIGQPAVFLC